MGLEVLSIVLGALDSAHDDQVKVRLPKTNVRVCSVCVCVCGSKEAQIVE